MKCWIGCKRGWTTDNHTDAPLGAGWPDVHYLATRQQTTWPLENERELGLMLQLIEKE